MTAIASTPLLGRPQENDGDIESGAVSRPPYNLFCDLGAYGTFFASASTAMSAAAGYIGSSLLKKVGVDGFDDPSKVVLPALLGGAVTGVAIASVRALQRYCLSDANHTYTDVRGDTVLAVVTSALSGVVGGAILSLGGGDGSMSLAQLEGATALGTAVVAGGLACCTMRCFPF